MFFDIKVIDTDAPSYSKHTPEYVLESVEIRIYIHAVKDCRGIFIPLVDTETSLIEWQLHILRASGRNHLHKFVGVSEKGIHLHAIV